MTTLPATSLIPVTFGESPTLFGMLTIPQGVERRKRGVVICPPLGHENICAYRPLRTLAELIAERGYPVIRFDWPGCGDSGDADPAWDSAAHLYGWTRAVQEAVETLCAATGANDVSLVGLRIGATLGLAAAAATSVSEVALLAPYTTGRAYVRELRAFQALAEQTYVEHEAPPLPDGIVEASGFAVTAAEVDALESIDLGATTLAARRALVLAPQPNNRIDAFAEHLERTVPDTVSDVMPSMANLWTGPNTSALPRDVSERICTWLAAGPGSSAVAVRSARAVRPAALSPSDEVTEEIVEISTARGHLYAVTSAPAGADAGSDAWVVFLDAGRVRRVGPNRLWTTYARAWAASGLPSLRLDSRGIGDSDGSRVVDETPGQNDGQSYVPELIDDVCDTLDWLSANRQAKRFALIGLCSGATWGFQTALIDDRVHGVALVNPRTLLWDPAAKPLQALRDALRIARDPRSWRRALAGQRPGARDVVRGVWFALRGRARPSQRRWIMESIAQLRARNTTVLTVFSANDLGLPYFQRQLGADFESVLRGGGATVEIIRGPDHTFRPLWSHEVLRQVLERDLRQLEFLRQTEAATIHQAH